VLHQYIKTLYRSEFFGILKSLGGYYLLILTTLYIKDGAIVDYLSRLWSAIKYDTDPIIVFCVVLLVIHIGLGYADHQFRIAAQQNENLYEVMLIMDGFGFVSGGGEPFTYRNKYKWEYAQWLNSPDRTWLEKTLFWKTGFFWDASNPPDEYQYPPLFNNNQ